MPIVTSALPVLACAFVCGPLAGRGNEEEEGPPGEEDEGAGVSLTSGPGDPASPATLVHKADRCGLTATRNRGEQSLVSILSGYECPPHTPWTDFQSYSRCLSTTRRVSVPKRSFRQPFEKVSFGVGTLNVRDYYNRALNPRSKRCANKDSYTRLSTLYSSLLTE